MSNGAIQNVTLNTYFEEDAIETNSNNEAPSFPWMLKLILLQLALCCLFIVCYVGIRRRIKKINTNKIQIRQQINTEKHKNSAPQAPQTNPALLTKFNNSGGISMFAMPQPSNSPHLDATLREISDSSMDGEDEHKNNSNNNRIKQLLIKMRNKTDRNDKEIEMSAYEQSGDGLFSLRSTFPNGTLVSVHRTRIDTDNTFPSIPNEPMLSDDNQSAEGFMPHLLALQTTRTMDDIDDIEMDAPTPMYCYNVGTPESSTYAGYRKTSYIAVCDKCGNAHAANCMDGEMDTVPDCNTFCKFNQI